ncbi:MFS transporter, partial [Streptomyces tibetensis]
FLSYGTIPIGALLGGALGTALDLRTAMAITTAGVPLAALILLSSPIRRSRDLPTSRQPTSDSKRPLDSDGEAALPRH